MDAPSQKLDADSSASTFSPSILRPSVLPDRLQISDADPKAPNTESPTKMTKPLVDPPILTPVRTISVSAEPTNTPGYVFGQNMGSRVVNAKQGASETICQAIKLDDYCNSSQDDTNSSVFTALARAVTKQSKEHGEELLEDSAMALAKKRIAAQMLLLSGSSSGGKQHEIITGEEDEITALELTCNAYLFDRDSKQWKNIGQSYLHLNDTTHTDQTTSRLIIRLQSTRRVVVNTRIWSEMPVAHVAENKAVRIGAMTITGQDQTDSEGAIRTYMLRFTSDDLALHLYEALQERRLSAEKLETHAKRGRLEKLQTSAVEGISEVTDASELANREQEKSHETEHQKAATSDGDSVAKLATVTAMSFPCLRVRVYSASGTLTEEVESEEGRQNVMVNITDFPQSSASILEVTAPSEGAESLLTAAVGPRLAFCRLGDYELHLFCTTEASDGSDDAADGARLDKSCRLLFASVSDAERLYRSVLLRVVRLFIESAGIIKEPEELNNRQTSHSPNY